MISMQVLATEVKMDVIDETTAFESDRQWLDAHIELLIENFANHWIAVKGERVIASEVDLSELLQHLPDISQTFIEFIDDHATIEHA